MIAIVAAAVLLNLSYPPFRLLLPSFICLMPLVLSLERPAPVGRHALRGFWFGLLANGILFHWVAVALWKYNPALAWAYAPAIVTLGAYYAGLFGLAAWARHRAGIPLLVVFPLAWTALEWVLAHNPGIALAWLGLGSSLTDFPVLVQAADIVGARGITLLLVMANVALARLWEVRHDRRAVRQGAWVVAGVAVVIGYGAVRMRAVPVHVAGRVMVVQPNVEAREKWKIERQDSIVAATTALSAEGARRSRPHLIVWPEVAVPAALAHRPHWAGRLVSHVREAGAPLIVGVLEPRVAAGREPRWLNGAVLLEPTELALREPPYFKHSLVPLFEQFNGFVPGKGGAPFETPIGRVGVLICYETAFEQFARHHRKLGADVLVDLSNDAWFSATTGPSQHAAHLVMRAVENRRGVARAANTGPSVFVDPTGRRYARAPEGSTTSLTALLVTSDAAALYPHLGDWIGLLSVLATAVIALAAWWRVRSTRALTAQ